MTALWHEQQQHIVQGGLDAQRFVNSLMEYISGEVERVGREGISLNVKKYPCPECGKPLRRMRGSKGFFWGCTGYKDGCKVSFSDKAGRRYWHRKKPSRRQNSSAWPAPIPWSDGRENRKERIFGDAAITPSASSITPMLAVSRTIPNIRKDKV